MRPGRGLAATVVTCVLAGTGAAKAPAADVWVRNAVGVMTMPGAVVAVGGPSLRRLRAGTTKWETVHSVPTDSLHRVAADEKGERLLAAWSAERLVHCFGPGKQHRTFPKPDPGGRFQI